MRLGIGRAALAAALLSVTVGMGSAQSARPEIRARLQFARPADLDPVYNTRAADYFVYVNIFSQLVRWKPGGTELEPDLAERWTASPDGRVWTFYLRKGVQFHKGYGELTAQDVKFTLDRFMDQSGGIPNAAHWSDVEKIEAVDRYTIRFTLRKPSAIFAASPIASRSAMIVSQRAVLERGRDFSRNPIGTGPFIFQQWTSADEIVLTANDQYFRGSPKVARIVFVPILDEGVAVAALERGEIHAMWTRGSVEAESLLRANRNVTVEVVSRIGSVRFLAINPRYAPLADRRVRLALAYAINKKELELASGGQLRTTYQPLPDLPWLRAAAQAGAFPVYPNDPARAKQLLASSGYSPLRVTLTFSLSSPVPLIAEILAEQFRRVGIDVRMEGVEQRAWNTRWRASQFELTPASLGSGPDPDETARDLLHTANFPPGGNAFRYDRADMLIDDATREQDPVRRRRIYIALMKQVMTDLPYIPLANDNLTAAWRAPIKRMITGIDNDFQAFTIEVAGR
jgi:peptide/nickel transport system substrate-binding protein